MTYYLAIVFVAYFFVLILLMTGFDRALRTKIFPATKKNFISIIIAARNEEQNIISALRSIAQLNYPKENFEVIVVNDHSDDRTLELAFSFVKETKIGYVVSLHEGAGKKSALAFGIENAKGNVIVTTDADCVVPINWLRRINELFQNKHVHLCVGAVRIVHDGKIFSILQSVEFASVIGSGAATLGWQKPTMCNGANLAFRKQSFEEVNGYEGNLNFASGDDQFLMAKIHKRFPDSVLFLPFSDAVVFTHPVKSVVSFFQQRIRWAGKWAALSSTAKSLAVFIFLVQLSWMMLLITFFSAPDFFMGTLLSLKVLLEFIFLFKVQRFLSQPFRSISFLVLQFAYAPYVIVTAIVSQFKTFTWKGRRWG